MKTYVTYCKEHKRPINQEILRGHMYAIGEQKKQQKLLEKQKQKQKQQHYPGVAVVDHASDAASVSVSAPPLYSDSQDCEEDLVVFEKKKRQRRRGQREKRGEEKGKTRLDSKRSTHPPHSNSGKTSNQTPQNMSAENSRIHTSSSVLVPAMATAMAFLTRETSPVEQKTRDNGSSNGGGGDVEGSRARPVCLDSDSDDDPDDNDKLQGVLPSTSSLPSVPPAAPRSRAHKAVLLDRRQSATTSNRKKRKMQPSGDSAMDSLRQSNESLPELVIPSGQYFDDKSGRCLPYTPFAINALEMKDLFGPDVFDEGADSSRLSHAVNMNPNLSTRLKPHQREVVQFMWKNVMLGVLDYSSTEGPRQGQEGLRQSESESQEDAHSSLSQKKKKMDLTVAAGHGCVVAHFMGLGKTLSIISFLTTIM